MKMDEEEENVTSADFETGTDGTELTQTQSGSNDGLSENLYDDANAINVDINDKDAPIVVLFGPPSCGKTMILTRLTRYLTQTEKGYSVELDTTFRPAADTIYQKKWENFEKRVCRNNSDDEYMAAAESTDKIDFMLLKVYKNSKVICQLLEGPGELYFSPEAPMAAFPKFVNKIANCNNRKIWAIITEPDNTNPRMDRKRGLYVKKINEKLVPKMGRYDGIIFVYNKIDATKNVIRPGEVDIAEARREVSNKYQGIFDKFMNTNPITKLFKPYNFDFVPFQTGDYSVTNDGKYTFEDGHDVYPRMLWKAILNQIKG